MAKQISLGNFNLKPSDVEDKRKKSRANVLIDMDDYNIIAYVYVNSPHGKVPLSEVKDFTNLSHNSFVIHIRRLKSLKLLDDPRGEGDDFRTKYIILTDLGKQAYDVLTKSIDTKEKWLNHMDSLYNYFTETQKTLKGKNKGGSQHGTNRTEQ